jgi:hypothetical protein
MLISSLAPRRVALLALAHACFMLAQAPTAHAQSTSNTNTPPGNGSGRPPGPPPEAFQACSGKASGASCSMTMPDGKTLTGTCEAGGPPPNTTSSSSTQTSTALACRPSMAPGGTPPQR